MDSNTMQRMRDHIKLNEGEILTPYKDNKGKLTIGTGFLVDDEKSFVAMPFQIKDPKTGEPRPATEAEKKAEFQRAKGLSNTELRNGPGKSRLSLPDAENKRRLDTEITTRVDKIKSEVGADNWDRLTPGQQTAVLDVHYANGGLKGFPSLKKGIETGNAEEIGKNVDFHSGGARNWGRIERNRAEAQGISLDEAKRQVEADRQAGKFELPAQPNQVDTATPQPQAPEPPTPHTAEPLEQKQSEAPADPRVAEMMAMAGAPETNRGRSALLKPVESLTQDEMMAMIDHAQGDYRGWRSGDPLKAHTYEKVQDWHASVYGDGPQHHDGGKPIEPRPIRPIPEKPSAHVTPQGEDLWKATERLGGKVADAAGADGYADAVKGLQRGLNLLNQSNPLPQRQPAHTPLGPVEEDGRYGPQTDFALKHATARLGPAKVEEGVALGRFNTFARQAQSTGNAEGLEDKTHSIFGHLLREDDQGPKVEAGVLQETLNDLGPRTRDDWQPLKIDDWIGPKTTAAFGQVLEHEDADGLTRAFGRNLGLL